MAYPTLTLAEMQEYIKAQVETFPSIRDAATAWNISHQYLSDVLHGQRRPGITIVRALGYRQQAIYVHDTTERG